MAVNAVADPGPPLVRRAAVLGSPIAHSLSPVLHRAAYRELGLAWKYEAIEMTPQRLPDFVASRDASWVGLSLTMPLKIAVLDLVDDLDPHAILTRCANTVVFDAGTRHGYNTDVFGITAALRSEAAGQLEAGPGATRSATIIGAGATARSAIAALSELGVRDVTVIARRQAAVDELGGLAQALAVNVTFEPLAYDLPGGADGLGAERAGGLGADIVISTVPPGAADQLARAVPGRVGVLLDVVYSPWPTKLAAAWRSAGGTVVGGLSMLVWQAAEQIRLMTGCDAPTAAMRHAGEAALG